MSAKAKMSQRKFFEKFWEENGITVDPITGLADLAGGEGGVNLAGVAADIANPGVGDVGLNVFDLWPQEIGRAHV